MVREARQMMFISKVPALIGEKQRRENRLINQMEIASETGLRRQTVLKWTKDGASLGNLDPDTVNAWLAYFNVTLNDLVDLVEKPREHAN